MRTSAVLADQAKVRSTPAAGQHLEGVRVRGTIWMSSHGGGPAGEPGVRVSPGGDGRRAGRATAAAGASRSGRTRRYHDGQQQPRESTAMAVCAVTFGVSHRDWRGTVSAARPTGNRSPPQTARHGARRAPRARSASCIGPGAAGARPRSTRTPSARAGSAGRYRHAHPAGPRTRCLDDRRSADRVAAPRTCCAAAPRSPPRGSVRSQGYRCAPGRRITWACAGPHFLIYTS